MIHFRTRLFRMLERAFGLVPRRTVSATLLGRSYQVLAGTLGRCDYDDAWLFALAHESKVVFDVGCNIGQSTLLLLHPGQVQEIVAVDANPTALAMCAQNLMLNHLERMARFVCAFAASESGAEVEFYTVGSGAAGSKYAGHAATAKAVGAHQTVPTVSLDALAQQYGLAPDLVKIDTEGAESEVLDGARAIASSNLARFFVEMHAQPELSMADNAARVLRWCSEVRYTPWYMKTKTPLTDPQPIAGRGRCHLLLLPTGMELPECLLRIEQGAALEAAVPAVQQARKEPAMAPRVQASS